MVENYKGYFMFKGNDKLSVWNRCATLFNIRKDLSEADARNYAKEYSKDQRQQMMDMFTRIKEEGYTKVRKEMVA